MPGFKTQDLLPLELVDYHVLHEADYFIHNTSLTKTSISPKRKKDKQHAKNFTLDICCECLEDRKGKLWNPNQFQFGKGELSQKT